MLINSNSKLCNYNTSAKIQIIWCPWGEQVRMYFMFYSVFLRPWKQCSSPWLAPLPPAICSCCFSSFLAKRQNWSWQLASSQSNAALHGAGRNSGMPSYFWPGTRDTHNLQDPSFSQWPKWPLIYLQNVNWRCHGNRTTLPGSVKIHFYLRPGRGQKRKEMSAPGRKHEKGWSPQCPTVLEKSNWLFLLTDSHTSLPLESRTLSFVSLDSTKFNPFFPPARTQSQPSQDCSMTPLGSCFLCHHRGRWPRCSLTLWFEYFYDTI